MADGYRATVTGISAPTVNGSVASSDFTDKIDYMKITNVVVHGSEITADVVDGLEFTPLHEVNGQRVEGVSVSNLPFMSNAEVHFVRIDVGGNFVLHTGPQSGFVQVVRGRGKLLLPDGVRIPYVAPELFLFRPETLHGWGDIEEDSLMAACLIS